MAKVEGLNIRGLRYYVCIIIPDDLKATYGKPRVNLSLGTSDKRTATLMGTLKRAAWLADFEAKRSALKPSAIAAVSPQFAALLAERVRAAVLGQDDGIRSNLPVLADLVRVRREIASQLGSGLRIPTGQQAQPPLQPPRLDDLTGMTPDELETLAGLNAFLDGNAAVALASGNLAVVLPIVQAEARSVGVAFNAKTPGAREALLLSLKAYRVAHRERTLRDAGEVVDNLNSG